MAEDLIGQRGRLVGDHPWSGHAGVIVRIEHTVVGYGAVVRLDGGQEAFVFDALRHWRKEVGRG